MSRLSSALRWLLFGAVSIGLLVLAVLAAAVWYVAPSLPSAEELRSVQLQTPLRVYTRDALLIAEFGEKRRTPLSLSEIPPVMVEAVIAAEDERFYEHPGVDWQGLTRAVVHLLRTGEKGPGGSTVTMQVARNFFLGREKTVERKFKEILLALQIERLFSKDEILELYFNKIFFGHRAYGVGAAAQVYYGKTLGELELVQIAMIAGLPKAPSRFNPIVNPGRAIARRNYVLARMREVGFLEETVYRTAILAPVSAKLHGLRVEVTAPYVAEMVRAEMEARFGDAAYTSGFRVYTTLDSARQRAATAALRKGLLEYDRRHGSRGPELHVESDDAASDYESILADIPVVGGLPPAMVVEVDEQVVTAHAKGFGLVEIPAARLEWARPYISENRRGVKPKSPHDVVEVGDVVRVQLTEEGWGLVQVPAVEGALVALDPNDGAIVALAGGFDFYRSKFNRVTQAQRQPGSSFKPFIYSAALASGMTPATFINDAPVVFEDVGLEDMWRPENYSGKFFGPTRLRVALYKSRNLASIRVLHAMGIDHAMQHLRRFGLDAERLPANLSLAVGSGELTPLELATGYAVIANGGYRIEPYFIDRVEDSRGVVVDQAAPVRVCRECEQDPPAAETDGLMHTAALTAHPFTRPRTILDPMPAAQPAFAPRAIEKRNVWLMNSMMRDVIRRGTGRKALQLERNDLAGKTGTTNDFRDAWFSGFTPNLVATAWVGFDQYGSLGRREAGSRAALPMWIDFMREALDGVPEEILEQPEGLVTMRIDPDDGRAALATDPGAIFETFRAENAPTSRSAKAAVSEVADLF